MKLFAGVIIGIVIATVGFSGVANILDHGVNTVKQTTKELSQ